MAATEANAAPVVQEDGKAAETTATEPETKATEAESAVPANSETVSGEEVGKDGEVTQVAAGNTAENKDTVANDTAAAAGEIGGEGGEEAPTSSENTSSSTEPKTSFLDSFLNKSGLGKVMSGRKKKEETAPEAGGDKEAEKGAEEVQGAEGEGAVVENTPENGEKEENEEKKEEKARSSVRDLIRNPVARIFSHRSTDKKEGGTGEAQPKPLTVRSKSLDRLEDPEALNTTAASSDAPVQEEGTEEEQKASSSTTSSSSTKHMKRWHSFKKLMAQKTHKKGAAGAIGEEVKEEEAEGGGGDSSTLDSKDSGQKRWKLKRSWTFQGLKRDPSMVGISSKIKDNEETPVGADGGEEAKPEEGGEGKTDGGEEAEGGEEKTEGAEEAKVEEKAGTSGGGTVTQHANEIWTSFKKRVIPKSKRSNTECAPSGEEDAPAGHAAGETMFTM